MNKELLIAYQFIHSRLLEVEPKADNRLKGRITLDTEVRNNLLKLTQEATLADDSGYTPQGNKVSIKDLKGSNDGTDVLITLEGLVARPQFFIGESWEKLLEYSQYLTKPPELLYFRKSKELIDQDSNNEQFASLKKIAWVLEQLKSNADHNTNQASIFLHHQNIEIPLKADTNILKQSFQIESLRLVLDDELHKSAKKSLFKTVLCEMVGETKKDLRLFKLVSEFDVFVSRFEIAFHSYVTDYSFDKIRKEFEEKRTEYIQKVNNTFQDISSKLIVLPAPLWLAITQGKNITINDTIDYIQLYKNITIFFVSVVVWILLALMISGQNDVLKNIKTEYTNLFVRLKSEFPEIKLDDENELKSLNQRYQTVWWQLVIAQIANTLLALFSIVVVCQLI